MVSICMATYNGGKYIKEQLDSILLQIKCYDEIVVSDDGSTDNTLDIIKKINDPRIKVLNHVKRYAKYSFDYTTHNFENAISNCCGDFIFLSDQDDVWMPNKYFLMMNALDNSDIVVSDCSIVNDNLKLIKRSKFESEKINNRIWNNVVRNKNIGCCMAFKRSILKTILPFPRFGVAQDFWIAVYGGLFYKVCYINQPLILYRRHDENVSSTSKKSTNSLSIKLGYRCRSVLSLIYRAGLVKVLKKL